MVLGEIKMSLIRLLNTRYTSFNLNISSNFLLKYIKNLVLFDFTN